ncbi:MAG: sigma-70 family RNA polymerase sigma factor [Variovorax sp.]
MPTTVESFDYEAALEACARGERFALRMLYEREARWLLAVAQRIVHDREMAHDVLQEAFLQVWQRASTYRRSRGSGRGWLYTVVRHRALDEARRVKREVFVGDDLEAIADHAPAHEAQALPHADTESLHRCLEALDERKRECIVSAFVEGYTHEQIALRLSMPVGTVKSWIRRGLLSLRECLS